MGGSRPIMSLPLTLETSIWPMETRSSGFTCPHVHD